MRILWFSDAPWAATGYGVQTRLFAPRLRALGHDVALATKYGLQGGLLKFAGCQVYPNGRDEYSQDVLAAHSRHFGADVTVTLCDAAPLQPRLYRGMRWVAWFPVDTEPLPDEVFTVARQSFLPIVFSRFGERVAREAGLDVRYAPLGVDTSVFRPQDKAGAREALGIPADRYVVGMVADNKDPHDRKAFCAQIAAFEVLKSEHPDALLYLHTNSGADGRGLDLVALCGHFGLSVGRDVVFCDQYLQLVGYPDHLMAKLYASFDVLLAASSWEGFGVPLIEAQACGTPVITGYWGATAELAIHGCPLDDSDTEPRVHPTRGPIRQPRTGAVVDALLSMYGAPATDQQRLHGLIARQYACDHIAEHYWGPLLAEIEQRIAEPTRQAVPA